jgi:hypothetical protein
VDVRRSCDQRHGRRPALPGGVRRRRQEPSGLRQGQRPRSAGPQWTIVADVHRHTARHRHRRRRRLLGRRRSDGATVHNGQRRPLHRRPDDQRLHRAVRPGLAWPGTTRTASPCCTSRTPAPARSAPSTSPARRPTPTRRSSTTSA